MHSLDVACICQNEEEVLPWMLRACETLLPALRTVVLVDGGSTDSTLDVIQSWRHRVPIALFHHPFDNFMAQKNRALEKCTADWIVLADSDMTWTSNLRDEILNGSFDSAPFWDVPLYYTVVDAYHYETSSKRVGVSTRFCKNVGARYVRPIHEYLCWPGEEKPADRMAMDREDWESIRRNGRLGATTRVAFFERTLNKSDDALRAKCARYEPFAELSTKAGIYMVKDRDRLMNERNRLVAAGQYAPLPDQYKALVIEGA